MEAASSPLCRMGGERGQGPFPRRGLRKRQLPRPRFYPDGRIPPLPPPGKGKAGGRGSGADGGGRRPRSAVPPPRAGGPRVKRGASPPARSGGRTGMLSQDSDFLPKCLDFLSPRPPPPSGIVRAARGAAASSPRHMVARPFLRRARLPRLAWPPRAGTLRSGSPARAPRPPLPAAPRAPPREPRSPPPPGRWRRAGDGIMPSGPPGPGELRGARTGSVGGAPGRRRPPARARRAQAPGLRAGRAPGSTLRGCPCPPGEGAGPGAAGPRASGPPRRRRGGASGAPGWLRAPSGERPAQRARRPGRADGAPSRRAARALALSARRGGGKFPAVPGGLAGPRGPRPPARTPRCPAGP